MNKIEFVETTPPPDRPEPLGGWRPTCRVEDHEWMVRCEAGSMYLECLDACSPPRIEAMDPSGATPGCLLEKENLIAEFGPFHLKWEKESYGWEYPNEYDMWVEIVESQVDVN